MILYHRTTRANAESIIREGFQDGCGHYLTREVHTGVWLSNVPLDCNEGAEGDTLLEVDLDIDPKALQDNYEWQEQGKGYRELLIPAAILKTCIATVKMLSAEEEFDL